MKSLDVEDTIVAIASPPGASHRGIVRLSGPQTMDCLDSVCVTEEGIPFLETVEIRGQRVFDCCLKLESGSLLPGSLLVWPDKRSYTRQPTAEFHTFGSPPLLQSVTQTLCQQGARLAERGEFTLRAFLSGRLDLTQAEAVLGVIDSNNELQLANALTQLSGGLTGPLTSIREMLIGVLAELEAGLDFVEEDIEFISNEELTDRLNEAFDALTRLNQQVSSRNLERQAFKVVLVGPPNSGKSSLFNLLTEQDSAIVTNIEGTTRDFLTNTIRWQDLDIELIDTAGLEASESIDGSLGELPSASSIESSAQNQSVRQIENADVALFCVAADTFPIQPTDSGDIFKGPIWKSILELRSSQPPTSNLIVVTKSDLIKGGEAEGIQALVTSSGFGTPYAMTSSNPSSQSVIKSGKDSLKTKIATVCQAQMTSGSSFVGTTAVRVSESLDRAMTAVETALQAVQLDVGLEIVAAEIRGSLDELGCVVGTVYTDDILDQVFGRFCIGK